MDFLTKEKTEMGEKRNNYPLAIALALVAALIGAIAWGIVGTFGWIIGWAGFLIAFLASKFYSFAKVKTNMVKFVTVLVCVVIGVTLGTYIGYVGAVYIEAQKMGLGFTVGDCIIILAEIWEDVSGDFIKDLLMGYLFGILGSLTILKDISASRKAVLTPAETDEKPEEIAEEKEE